MQGLIAGLGGDCGCGGLWVRRARQRLDKFRDIRRAAAGAVVPARTSGGRAQRGDMPVVGEVVIRLGDVVKGVGADQGIDAWAEQADRRKPALAARLIDQRAEPGPDRTADTGASRSAFLPSGHHIEIPTARNHRMGDRIVG